MSQLNFGESYFATRERLSQVIEGISKLAKQTQTNIGDTLTGNEEKEEIATPFLFVVCGEVNAGKSSLINGLFGRELCKVNILPETDRVIWYRYGMPPRDVDTTPSLQERFCAIEFLRDFNLVDTPGTNSVVKGHQEITERFLPVADLIFFVFPVTNPWGAATWNLISRIPKECHSRMVFILQQADQRDSTDLKVILNHMADLSVKRIGLAPQMFAVSGKLASEAKRAGSFGKKNYLRSGFADLEEFISRRVCDSPERRAALQTWRGQAGIALRMIEDRMEEQTQNLDQQNAFLVSLEGEIDLMREQLVSRLPRHLSDVAEVFETEAIWVTKSLSRSLGLLRSMIRVFVGDKTGKFTENLLVGRLRTAVETVAESDGDDIVNACRDHWQKLGLRVKDTMGVEIENAEPVNERLEQAKARFIQRIGRAAHQSIGNLRIRKDLERELRRRNLALKSFTATTLIFLILAAITGILEFPWLPWLFALIAGLFLVGGAVISMATKIRISKNFKNSLLDTCGTFAENLRTDYEDGLRIFFQDYTSCLGSVRKHLATEKIDIEPRLQRWHDLFLTLKSIEQDI
ncbi:MAG: dynamin family protein [Akkermansiaceae bacterium]